jgi:hypothetical protein
MIILRDDYYSFFFNSEVMLFSSEMLQALLHSSFFNIWHISKEKCADLDCPAFPNFPAGA